MTAIGTAPSAPPSETAPTSVGPADLWRRIRGPVGFVSALVALAVLVSLGAERPPEGLLEPEGPNPEGTRALVQVLQQRGSNVTVARGTDDAVAAMSGKSVLVLADSHRLRPEELDRISAASGDRVLIQPTGPALQALAPGLEMTGRTDADTLEPQCGLPAAQAAGSADMGGELYTLASERQAADPAEKSAGCYPGQGGAGDALVQLDGGTGTTTVLGTGEPLTNARLAHEGNAALALNLIGDRDVVWLLPDPHVENGQASLVELLPRSVRMAAVPLAVALVLLALWQGRRLGPLVIERLPVVVRASETAEGRAGLYASRRARDRAAAALRAGLISRLRPLLGLGPDATPGAVVAAVASRTGEDPVSVRALLYGPDSTTGADRFSADDAGLVRLADELDRLDGHLR